MPHDDQFEQEEEHLTTELVRGDSPMLRELLGKFPAPDLAELFPDLEEAAQTTMLNVLDDETVAELLAELDPSDQEIVLSLLSASRTQDVLEEMYSDDVADLLSELPEEHAEALIEQMEQDVAEDVSELLRYDEDSAGGLMAKEYVTVPPELTVTDALAMLRHHHDDAELIYELYVISEDESLLGIVSLHTLIVSPADAEMADIMEHEFV
ncbi:MAG: CBS domain-containing protein, partial [bacterium]